jgi:hypothetical protein
MADLTEIQSSQSVKITGANPSTGIETNWAGVDANGNLQVLPITAGPVTPGAAAVNSNLIGGQFNTILPTLTTGQQSAIQLDSSGRLIVSIGLDSDALAQGSTTSGQLGALVMGAVTTAPPSYTTAQTNSLSLTINGDLRTADIINTSGIYGTLTVGTSAIEIKVGGSKLANRKLVTIDNTSNSVIFWGWDSSITTSAYAGRIFKDQQASWAIGANVTIFLIASGAGNSVHISESS